MNNGEPSVWDEYINQEQAKGVIRAAIDGAKRRGESLDHVFIYGPSGVGKTALAKLISSNDIHLTYGNNFSAKPYLPSIKSEVAKESVWVTKRVVHASRSFQSKFLFIDEIHLVPQQVQEEMIAILESKQLTVIGATTRPDMLVQPLRNRFGIQLRLDFYESEHLVEIIRGYAGFLGIQVTPEAMMEIAKRSRGTPRVAKTLLRRIRDYGHPIDMNIAKSALATIGTDHYGLDVDERNYVFTIAWNGGGPIGLSTIAAQLSVEPKFVMATERFPLRCGLVEIVSHGRKLTKKGEVYIKELQDGTEA